MDVHAQFLSAHLRHVIHGWMMASFFFMSVCLCTETESWSVTFKKRMRPQSSHLEEVWCCCMAFGTIFQWVVFSIALLCSQSHCRNWFILAAHGARHLINTGYRPSVRARKLNIGEVLFWVLWMDRDGVTARANHIMKASIWLWTGCVNFTSSLLSKE